MHSHVEFEIVFQGYCITVTQIPKRQNDSPKLKMLLDLTWQMVLLFHHKIVTRSMSMYLDVIKIVHFNPC